MKDRHKYYTFTCLPYLIVLLIIQLLDFNLLSKLLFTVSYLWNLALRTPGMDERLKSERYRFSFMIIIHIITDFFEHKELKQKNTFLYILVRNFPPIFFCLLIKFMSGQGSEFLIFFGVFLFELIYFSHREIENRKDWFGV